MKHLTAKVCPECNPYWVRLGSNLPPEKAFAMWGGLLRPLVVPAWQNSVKECLGVLTCESSAEGDGNIGLRNNLRVAHPVVISASLLLLFSMRGLWSFGHRGSPWKGVCVFKNRDLTIPECWGPSSIHRPLHMFSFFCTPDIFLYGAGAWHGSGYYSPLGWIFHKILQQ